MKDRLSSFLERVKGGETVTITDRGRPVARLVPVSGDGLDDLRAMAERMGSRWTGGKPLGLPADAARECFGDVDAPGRAALRGAGSLTAAITEERDEQPDEHRDER